MRWKTVTLNWDAFHGPLMEAFPVLDENDLIRMEGDRAALEEHLVTLTGDSADDVAAQLDEWLEGAVPADVHMDEHHDNASITESGRYVPEGEDASDNDARFGDDATTDGR